MHVCLPKKYVSILRKTLELHKNSLACVVDVCVCVWRSGVYPVCIVFHILSQKNYIFRGLRKLCAPFPKKTEYEF